MCITLFQMHIMEKDLILFRIDIIKIKEYIEYLEPPHGQFGETLRGTERSCVLWRFYKYFVNSGSGSNFFGYNSFNTYITFKDLDDPYVSSYFVL